MDSQDTTGKGTMNTSGVVGEDGLIGYTEHEIQRQNHLFLASVSPWTSYRL